MRHTTHPRRSKAVASYAFFVFVLFALLLMGRGQVKAATLATITTETTIGDGFLGLGSDRPDYHHHNAEYWRVKGERMTIRRKGLLGWMLPKRSLHELAEKRRHNQRAPQSAHYRGRGGRKDNLLQLLGLAY